MGDFKGITGPGNYRMRNGGIVTILRNDGSGSLPWDGSDNYWRDNDGTGDGVPHDLDIIDGPLPDDAELAGLTGYIGIEPDRNGATTNIFQRDPESVNRASWPLVIDLSTIRKDQLVPPEQGRETRKVWFNVYADNISCAQDSRLEADQTADFNRVAVIERKITFTHGEGLGDVA